MYPAINTINDDHQGFVITDKIGDPIKQAKPETYGNDNGFRKAFPIGQPFCSACVGYAIAINPPVNAMVKMIRFVKFILVIYRW